MSVHSFCDRCPITKPLSVACGWASQVLPHQTLLWMAISLSLWGWNWSILILGRTLLYIVVLGLLWFVLSGWLVLLDIFYICLGHLDICFGKKKCLLGSFACFQIRFLNFAGFGFLCVLGITWWVKSLPPHRLSWPCYFRCWTDSSFNWRWPCPSSVPFRCLRFWGHI